MKKPFNERILLQWMHTKMIGIKPVTEKENDNAVNPRKRRRDEDENVKENDDEIKENFSMETQKILQEDWDLQRKTVHEGPFLVMHCKVK